ncbi:MAG: 3(2), 5-bisphosphate nucleotidase [Actinomycetota bacterium]|jgi:3'(2'), 5'-bisphosphate nucleotidase|nr:Inositol monophosphatase [Cryptosporangiaceae bacterium]MDQ1679027.1 3(2), 5-bisphosphate nucleotidase [Actinomycetota bacterium]
MQTDPTARPDGRAADDAALARLLADEAGRLLLEVRAATGFADPAALKAAGDRSSHELLMARLAALRPGDAVLSEEGADDPVRLGADRVWIVDPLDGTREFSEEGRTDWAVHVALWERGTLIAGAVALPARGVTLATDVPPVTPVRADGALRLAVSRSRPPAFVTALAERLGAELVPMGSAGVKVSAVVLGEVDAYVHGGGQYEWDSAAPAAVARAAGLFTSRLDGSPLRYNQPDPLLPDLIVCSPALAPAILDAVRPTGEGL